MIQDALVVAAEAGHAAAVSRLLSDPRVAPDITGLEAVRRAVLAGHVDVVALLLTDGCAETQGACSEDEPDLPCMACERGHLVTVDRLLTVPGLDAAQALVKSAGAGRLAIIERLLAVPGIDATAALPNSLPAAVRSNDLAVVNRLLAPHGVDATPALCVAIETSNLSIVDRALAVPGINAAPTFSVAVVSGNLAIVERILAVPGVNAVAPFPLAIRCGHLAIADRVLTVPGVDAAVAEQELNAALAAAMARPHAPLASRLLQLPDLRSVVRAQAGLRGACSGWPADAVLQLHLQEQEQVQVRV